MKKVLVVGLGGSGGKTIGFLMDEALAQLKDLGWESNKLPDCWSFVHIDVPPQVGLAVAGDGLAANVVAQGGEYIPLTNPNTTYGAVDGAVFSKFANSGDASGNGLQDLARWRPDPAMAPNGILAGAGAYRAIGRMLTLSASEQIHKRLEKIIKDLLNVKPDDGTKLAHLLGDGAFFAKDEPPLVILVSSMAGGTGSSMIMDVSDILNGLGGQIAGFTGDETSAFLYTADVFKAWPGVYARAGSQTLATVSEILHSQTRVNDAWTDREWHQLVSGNPRPDTQKKRGPSVVFPVGATVAGKSFGNNPIEIYRGFSRVLAPLLVSDDMQASFEAYAISNWKMNCDQSNDEVFNLLTPLKNTGGGGRQLYPGLFGGFGSATLSTGRDRYKEYAAQRIARRAAQILYDGFEAAANEGLTTRIAKLQAAANRIYPRVVSQLNIDGMGGFDPANLQKKVLQTYLGSATDYTQTFVTAFNQAFNNGEGTLVQSMLVSKWKESEGFRKTEISKTARETVGSWAKQIAKDLQEAIMIAISEYGVDTADEVLNLFGADLQKLAEMYKAQSTPASDNSIKAAVANIGRIKGGVAAANPAVSEFQKSVRSYVMDALRSQVNVALADTLVELQSSVVASLKREFGRLSDELKAEINAEPANVTSAAYREAPLSIWPRGNAIPGHFNPAVNEVLLTAVDSFATDFERDVVLSTPGITKSEDALTEIAKRVISRRETVVNGGNVTYGPIQGWKDGETNGNHPHFDFSEDWSPEKLNLGKLSNLKISMRISPAELRKYAHSWLELGNSPFEKACRLSISDWLEANPINKATFAQQLSQAITFASPLVDLSPEMLNFMHSGKHAGITYSFSSIPVAKSDVDIVNAIHSVLGSGPSATQNQMNFDVKCDPSSNVQVINIAGNTTPYSPWASRSLTDPVRTGYTKAMSVGGDLKAFWANTRGRALTQFVPLAEDRIQAFLRGWLVGRLTGRIKVVAAGVGGGQQVQVYRDATATGLPATWISFPNEVLGATNLGVENPLGGADATGWNIPAILLETIPLALARLVPSDISPWEPYQEVIKLGLAMYQFEGALMNANQPGSLDNWHSGADRDAGIVSDLKSVTDIESAKAWVAGVMRDMDAISRDPINSQNFWQVKAVREIAKPLGLAAQTVAAELARTNLGIKGTSVPASSYITPGVPAQPNGPSEAINPETEA
jgi:hypothetical protein